MTDIIDGTPVPYSLTVRGITSLRAVRRAAKRWLSDCKPQAVITRINGQYVHYDYSQTWLLMVSINGSPTVRLRLHHGTIERRASTSDDETFRDTGSPWEQVSLSEIYGYLRMGPGNPVYDWLTSPISVMGDIRRYLRVASSITPLDTGYDVLAEIGRVHVVKHWTYIEETTTIDEAIVRCKFCGQMMCATHACPMAHPGV